LMGSGRSEERSHREPPGATGSQRSNCWLRDRRLCFDFPRMSVTPARRIAFEILLRVEAEGAYATDLLHERLDGSIKPPDAALATELTLGVLRQRRQLDFALDPLLKKPVDRLDLPVALALRLGVYQIRFLDKVPVRAAVNESVELVKQARKASAASLVNAVLRRAGEQAARGFETLVPPELPLADRLGILHSHPTWMVERWLKQFGEARTIALLEANNRAPQLSCAIHDEAKHDDVLETLRRAGLRTEPGQLLRNAFRVRGGGPTRTDAFRSGWISIQDEASQVIPLLLDVQAGERVLDVCAAPGGKTATLVRGAGGGGFVIAADRHAHRLGAMQEQFERLKLARVALIELDAEQPLPFGAQFHRILVDAPCSGTGTLARHPEIRWRLRREQLAELHDLQVRILTNALAQLAPGGQLVYSTCSLEPEENEDVVAEVLRATPSVRPIPGAEAALTLAPHLAPGISAEHFFDGAGYFRTSPADDATDGFFAAILTKA
jgi:16S rRNA (cytosine967-C5)-methyltransferase